MTYDEHVNAVAAAYDADAEAALAQHAANQRRQETSKALRDTKRGLQDAVDVHLRSLSHANVEALHDAFLAGASTPGLYFSES